MLKFFSIGFLFIYEVETYAMESETDAPRCKSYNDRFSVSFIVHCKRNLGLRTWRAHVDSVTGLQYIDQST